MPKEAGGTAVIRVRRRMQAKRLQGSVDGRMAREIAGTPCADSLVVT